MALDTIQYLLGAGSGGLVGFTLGLVGGGGSILAVPLMVYLVGVPQPHIAIGTSALAVAVNAGASLVPHARAGTIKWRCASMFAAAGVTGAYAGSTLGKAMDGQRLLFLFALLMLVVGALMIRNRKDPGNPDVQCRRENAPKVMGYGLGTGLFSGFFRHWRWFSDRSGADGIDCHADAQRGRLIARGRHRFRADGSRQLRLVGTRGLGPRGCLHPGRRRGRHRRNTAVAAIIRNEGAAQHSVRRADLRRGNLHAVAKCNSVITDAAACGVDVSAP